MTEPNRRQDAFQAEHDHGPCVAEALKRAEEVFEQRGLRLTPLRREVLQEIAGSHVAIGAYDVLERLARRSGRRLAPISVYRALDSLLETGLVHRLECRSAFFACHTRHTGSQRQIILACEACSQVVEIEGESLFDRIAELSTAVDFVPTRTHIEVTGTCARCARMDV